MLAQDPIRRGDHVQHRGAPAAEKGHGVVVSAHAGFVEVVWGDGLHCWINERYLERRASDKEPQRRWQGG